MFRLELLYLISCNVMTVFAFSPRVTNNKPNMCVREIEDKRDSKWQEICEKKHKKCQRHQSTNKYSQGNNHRNNSSQYDKFLMVK